MSEKMGEIKAEKKVNDLVKRFVSKDNYITGEEKRNLRNLFGANNIKTVEAALELYMQEDHNTYGNLPSYQDLRSCISQAKANFVKSKLRKGYCPCCGNSGLVGFLYKAGKWAGYEVFSTCRCKTPNGKEPRHQRDKFDICENVMCRNKGHAEKIEVPAGFGGQAKYEIKNCKYNPVITEQLR